MKQEVKPGLIAAVVIALIAVVVLIGWKSLSSGSGQVDQATVAARIRAKQDK